MTRSQLRSYIREILTNAVDNGYAIHTWTAIKIVNDMRMCDDTCAGYPEHLLLPHVSEWLDDHAPVQLRS